MANSQEPHQTTLSTAELQFVQDTQFLLAKHRIADKLQALFGQAEASIQAVLNSAQNTGVPADALAISGKLSRGENYQQLPYMILDFPRKFKGNEVFAYRTMFWWGGF